MCRFQRPEIFPRADQLDAALLERLLAIATSRVGSKLKNSPRPSQVRHMPLRAVEAEQLRRRLVEAEAALGAGEVRRENDVARLRARGAALRVGLGASWDVLVFFAASSESRPGRSDVHGFVRRYFARPRTATATMTLPLPIASADIDRFGKSAANRWRRLQPVDHHLDVVPHLPIERQLVGERDDAAIDAGAHEALLPQVFEQVVVLALLTANHGREHGELRPGRERHDAADDLLARLGRDRPPHCGQCPWPTRAYSTRRKS